MWWCAPKRDLELELVEGQERAFGEGEALSLFREQLQG